MRPFKSIAGALVLGLVILAVPGCGTGGPAPAESLKAAIEDAAMAAPGVASAQIHVNMNTSGNFISAKLVGTTSDEAGLAQALAGALPGMLKQTEHLQSGTFSTSIYSPDGAVSVGADALGFPGGNSLKDFREFFLNRP